MKNMTLKFITNKLLTGISLIFLFIFFFTIELRWQFSLLGITIPNLYILLACVGCFVILVSVFKLFTLFEANINFEIAFALIVYFFCVMLVNSYELSFLEDYSVIREVGVWLVNIALFISAANKFLFSYIYKHRKVILFLFFCYVLSPLFLLFMTGYAVESSYSLRHATRISGMWWDSDFGVLYQTFGDKLALLTFVVLPLQLKRAMRIITIFIAFISLYVVGSKASLVGFIFSCCVCCLLYCYWNKQYIKIALIILLSICGIFFTLFIVVGNESLQHSNNWFIRTLASGREDVSVSSRARITQLNAMTRNDRLLLGDYQFDYKLGRKGSYTHNAIGLIDYYGVLIFSVATGLWMYFLVRLIQLKRHNGPTATALMSMLFYTLLFAIARFPPNSFTTFWVLGLATLSVAHTTSSTK